MYCAVGVSATNAAICLSSPAPWATSLRVLNTFGVCVGWIEMLMNARLVEPIWSPNT